MFRPVLNCTPLSIQSVIEYSIGCINNKKLDAAIHVLRSFMDIHGLSPLLCRSLSYAYAQYTDFDNAFLWIEKALSMDPASPESYSQQGLIYSRLHLLDQAQVSSGV